MFFAFLTSILSATALIGRLNGFKFDNSVITNVALSEGDMMNLDVSVKAVGAGIGSSTDLFEVAC